MIPNTLLEVVTPASSQSLIELDTLKGDLGIVDGASDARLERIVASVSWRIAGYVGRPLIEQEYRETWRLPANGLDAWSATLARDRIETLRLSRVPVTSILDVVEAGTTLASDLYVWMDTVGLARLDASGALSAWASGIVQVRYRAGWVPPGTTPSGTQQALPPDLAEAALEAARADWFAKGRDPGVVVRSEDVPDVYSVTYDTRTAAAGEANGGPGTYGLPATVRGVLDAHQRTSFAF